ncbi:MAG TPA: TadE/TadG family type IV pilus assembly protein [Bryobacteraceae bacterium]|nr:TadE/TadG family type IV pilus assembly protein [Bryobacteraceae bacterium]
MMNTQVKKIHSNPNHRKRCRGGSVLESALVLPWFLFLFVGAFDWGFFAHALISTESATRVAALYAAGQSSAPSATTLCPIVRNELKVSPNITDSLTCSSSPLVVSVDSSTGPDGQTAYTVQVAYTTAKLIPIPGLLTNQVTITRTVEVRPRV